MQCRRTVQESANRFSGSRHTWVEMDGICELGQAAEWAMGMKVLSAMGRGCVELAAASRVA